MAEITLSPIFHGGGLLWGSDVGLEGMRRGYFTSRACSCPFAVRSRKKILIGDYGKGGV